MARTPRASGAPRAEKSALLRAQNDVHGARPRCHRPCNFRPGREAPGSDINLHRGPLLMSTLYEALIHDFLNILLIPLPKAKG